MLNVEELSASIIKLIENPLQNKSIIKSSESFSLETVVSAYIKVLTNY